MALTRKFLKALGIEDEKADQIIEAHGETVDGLKSERDEAKASAEKATKDLNAANEKLAKNGESVNKDDYEKLKKEFDDYKKGISTKEIREKKENAFRELLKEAKVSEKVIDKVIKISDIDGIELDDKGQIKDAETRSESIKSEWAEFIVTEGTEGAGSHNPPKGGNENENDLENLSMADYIKARSKK